MDQVLTLRPFLPAKDLALSTRFYQALGFRVTMQEPGLAFLKSGSFSFILKDFYAKEVAEHTMLQMLVRNVDAWWREADPAGLVAEFGVRPPRAPEIQPWGMRVGFFNDPSGVLWHVAEAPF